MDWIDSLRGSMVGLNTAPLIYFIEEHPAYLPKVERFFEASERGEFRIVPSLVTLIEVLVHPIRAGRQDLAREYRNILLHSSALATLPLDEGIADSGDGNPRRRILVSHE